MNIQQLLQRDKEKTLLVDIRETNELKMLPPIDGAIHIPLSTFGNAINTPLLPQDKKIITICHSGGRCLMVNQTLQSLGYDVDYLEGGMATYIQSGS